MKFISKCLIFLLVILSVIINNQRLSAQGEVDDMIKDSVGTILNKYDTVLGFVKNNGQITNRFGAPLGSVEDDGTIYNVSKIVIGRVSPSTMEVFNQSGTVLGSVTPEGDVFNINGDKLGSILIESGDIIMIGGAARLILF